jgi:hypothetical protein
MQCPKCKCDLAPSGVIELDGQQLAVYQCDNCLVPCEFDGATFEAALTFAVGPNGRLFDLRTFEALNLN